MISEVFSLLKTLLLAIVILFLMQFKVDNQSIENRVENWIERSPTSLYLQSVAAGAVNLIRQGSEKIKTTVKKEKAEYDLNKASR